MDLTLILGGFIVAGVITLIFYIRDLLSRRGTIIIHNEEEMYFVVEFDSEEDLQKIAKSKRVILKVKQTRK